MSLIALPTELLDEIFSYFAPYVARTLLSPPAIAQVCRNIRSQYFAWYCGSTVFQVDSSSAPHIPNPIDGWLGRHETPISIFLCGLDATAIEHVRKLHISATPAEMLWLFAPMECIHLLEIPLESYPHWRMLRRIVRDMRLNELHFDYDPEQCCPYPYNCLGIHSRNRNAIDDRWIWKAVHETMRCRIVINHVCEMNTSTTHYSPQELLFATTHSCSWSMLQSMTSSFQKHTSQHFDLPGSPSQYTSYRWFIPVRPGDLEKDTVKLPQ